MEFLEVPIFDDDVYKLLVRFFINLIFVTLVVWLAYYPHRRAKGLYVFTFLMMNAMVFFICFSLKKLDLGLGMALGLFAIFAIIRYRTDAIPVKEMTYLFIVIGLAVINSLSNKQTSYTELMFTNTVIFFGSLILEWKFPEAEKTKPPKKLVEAGLLSRSFVYDNLDLLKPNNEANLIADIRERTGLEASNIEVKKIDLAAGTASIVVSYKNGN